MLGHFKSPLTVLQIYDSKVEQGIIGLGTWPKILAVEGKVIVVHQSSLLLPFLSLSFPSSFPPFFLPSFFTFLLPSFHPSISPSSLLFSLSSSSPFLLTFLPVFLSFWDALLDQDEDMTGHSLSEHRNQLSSFMWTPREQSSRKHGKPETFVAFPDLIT